MDNAQRKIFDEIDVGEKFFAYCDLQSEICVKIDNNRYVDSLGLVTYLLQTDWHEIYISAEK